MAYGEVIKCIRKEKRMSLRAFGKLTDIDFTYIGLLEREKSTSKKALNPTIDILQQICDRTGYPFRKFLEEAGYIEPVPVVELSELQKECATLSPVDYEVVLDFVRKLNKNVENVQKLAN